MPVAVSSTRRSTAGAEAQVRGDHSRGKRTTATSNTRNGIISKLSSNSNRDANDPDANNADAKNEGGGYISSEGIRALAEFKYHAGQYSALDMILNPAWFYFSTLIPRWFSPNMVTLTGFSILSSGLLLMTLRTYYFYESWSRLLVGCYLALAYLLYQLFDAMDGKHARNTQQSTPLGALFDHGCDTFTVLLSMCIFHFSVHSDELYLSSLHDGAIGDHSHGGGASHGGASHDGSTINQYEAYMHTPIQFVNDWGMTFAMFLAQWEHYHRGILETECVTECQWFGAILCIFFGTQFVQSLLPLSVSAAAELLEINGNPTFGGMPILESLTLKDVVVLSTLVTNTFIASRMVFRVYRTRCTESVHGQHPHGHGQHPLRTLIPSILVCAAGYGIYNSNEIFLKSPLLWKIIIGMANVDLTLRIMLSGACNTRFSSVHLSLLPLICYGSLVWIDYLLKIDQLQILSSPFCAYFLLAFEILSVFWLSADTISRICGYLNIPFLAPLEQPFVYDSPSVSSDPAAPSSVAAPSFVQHQEATKGKSTSSSRRSTSNAGRSTSNAGSKRRSSRAGNKKYRHFFS